MTAADPELYDPRRGGPAVRTERLVVKDAL